MFSNDPGNKDGLAVSYSFDPDNVYSSNDGKVGLSCSSKRRKCLQV